MNDYEPGHPHATLPAGSGSSATGPSDAGSSAGAGAAPPAPPTFWPDPAPSAAVAEQARWLRVRRLLSRKITWIVAAAVLCAGIGLSVILGTSASTPSAQPAPGSGAAVGGPRSGGGGSNARSGPATGGAAGTVGTVSTSGFTMSTPTGQQVTVNEASATTYQNGSSSISASAITAGEPVLVLGTTSGTTITATQVIVQPTNGAAAASAAGVVPFQQGAPATAKQAGQVPANYTEGSGTIVSGTAANKATEAALAAYPGGVVDRVVQLSNGEYEVHTIGVSWPHHVFVSQSFTVLGAN